MRHYRIYYRERKYECMKKEVTVVEVNNVAVFPPVINLLDNLINNGHKVNFIGRGLNALPKRITDSPNYNGIEVRKSDYKRSPFVIKRFIDRCLLERKTRKAVIEQMRHSDVLWTTSYNTVKTLQEVCVQYKNVMQFMELADKGYTFNKITQFPLDEYARKTWKIVVAEKNRAYIEKAIWGLNKLPEILPNKPYYLETGEITEDMTRPLDIIKSEKRKIILYLGGIWPDRNLKPFASAIKKMNDEYCLYIIGKPYGVSSEEHLKELINNYGVNYLGGFNPPKHLEFIKYAHIGMLSYTSVVGDSISSLNALYCAPNKIYEYAAFGVPMIGNDLLGLRQPFKEYGIGECCDDTDPLSVESCIQQIETNYNMMKQNCKKFFDDTDLDKIVESILEEE